MKPPISQFIHSFLRRSLPLAFILFSAHSVSQPINPQPGENIWHLIAGVGTEVDLLAFNQTACCVGTFTTLNLLQSAIENIACSGSCNFSGTYTVLDAINSEVITIQSSIDMCCFDLNSKIEALTAIADFGGTFTTLADIRTAEFTIESKVDECCFDLNSKVESISTAVVEDFAGTFTVLNVLGVCNEKPFPTPGTLDLFISTTGVYCLTQDIDIGSSFIVISNADVVLNLNGHTISGSSSNGLILISSSNVTICNGSLFSTDPNNAMGINVNTARSNIYIHDLTLSNFSSGLSFTSLSNSLIQRIHVINPTNFGINIGNSITNVSIEDCIVDGIPTIGGTAYSLLGTTGTTQPGVTLNRCIANRGGNYGFFIAGCSATLTDCQSNSQGVGFNVLTNSTGGMNVIFKNCIAKANGFEGFSANGANADTTSCITFENCISESNSLQGYVIDRIPNSVFKQCVCTNNLSHGISISRSSNGVIKECVCSNNTGSGFIVGAIALTSNFTLQNCTASNNLTHGFDLSFPALSNCTVIGCSAINNSLGSGSFFGFNSQSATQTNVNFYLNNASQNGTTPSTQNYRFSPPGANSAPVSSVTGARSYGDNLSA
jgi:parallel beta-helix repeat protein